VSYPRSLADEILGTKYRGCFFGISMATGHTKHIACFPPRRKLSGYSNIALQ
jgi:hypothetical protein